ncbi:MAG: hypothetical protein HYZ75_13670 [Elusimicrobia bacterium]|nr:hypothetical protein [Elusimicrobiota bacterium]
MERTHLGLAALLAAGLAATARAEELNVTTYYPAPVGVYNNLRAQRYKFTPYQTRAAMDVPPMPDPGIFAYCSETGSYYASSPSGEPSEPGTWWYRVVLDDTPENIFAQGSKDDFSQPNNTYAWVKQCAVTTGKLYNSNSFIRSTMKTTQAGLYTARARGKLCEVLRSDPPPAAFVGATNGTVFKLRLRINGTYVSEKTAFTLAEAANQAEDCAMDPADAPPAEDAKCYCADFELDGQLSIGVRSQPYVGLLSYGTKTTTAWKASRRYGGYVVHLEDMVLVK